MDEKITYEEMLEQLDQKGIRVTQVAGTWPREDMPELLTPERGSALFNDAKQLLANGLGAANQLR